MAKKLMVAMAITILFIGLSCDKDSGGDDDHDTCDIDHNDYAPTSVSWWIAGDGSLNWDNNCDYSYFEYSGCQEADIIWCCADYSGSQNIYVDLSFEDCGAGWAQTSEYTSSGICEESCL